VVLNLFFGEPCILKGGLTMTNLSFIHLHNHTEYSLFDGCSKISDLVQKAKACRMNALAVTDHHNAFAWFPLHLNTVFTELQPIFGMELNIDKHHLTAICLNNQGMKNLITLNNLGYQKGGRPYVTESEFFDHHKGIFFLSGCGRGLLPSLAAEQNEEGIISLIDKVKTCLGDRFAVEIQNYGKINSYEVIKELVQIAKKNNLSVVPTNDCHYLNQQDAFLYNNLLNIQTNGKLSHENNHNFFKTTEEMARFFPSYLLRKSSEIIERVDTSMEELLSEGEQRYDVPLSTLHYFDDAEAIKKVFFSKKKYQLGQYFSGQVIKKNRVLEDFYQTGDFEEEIKMSILLRGKLHKISRDPHCYIRTNAYFPLYRKAKGESMFAQIDCETAQKLGYRIYDSRKKVYFF
jgi:DNA polymerase III alpha subunit